ncbi:MULTISPECIES: 4Fe-4S dicluster domain-containing protein [Cupriavidus]
MIELLDGARCTGCNICVRVCPTNVFAIVPGKIPAIARQQDCQTCFMCELYCPEDALYVTPLADACQPPDHAAAAPPHHAGSYRATVGWGKGREPTAARDGSHALLALVRPAARAAGKRSAP